VDVHTATRIGLEATFYTSCAFIIVTSAFWSWWRSLLGWSITLKTLALVLTTFPFMLTIWFGQRLIFQSTWIQWLAAIGVLSIPLVLIFRGGVIWWYSRHGGEPGA
jgi:hypothetical protein